MLEHVKANKADWVFSVDLTLLLLMAGILANHHHAAFALDDFALFTDRLHRGTNFHNNNLQIIGSGAFLPAARQPLERQVIRPRVRS